MNDSTYVCMVHMYVLFVIVPQYVCLVRIYILCGIVLYGV